MDDLLAEGGLPTILIPNFLSLWNVCSIQHILYRYLRDRRVNGEKRSAGDVSQEAPPGTTKRPRGRPKGSKNRASRAGGNASGGGAGTVGGVA